MEDAKVAQVASITGATPALASQYLTLADGDENQAVMLFFENGGADLSGQSSGPSNDTPLQAPVHDTGSASRPREGTSGVIHIDSDEEHEAERVPDDDEPQFISSRTRPNATTSSHRPDSTFDDDAALAARLQEEAYSGQEQEVRAPIARQAQTLVGPGAEQDFDDSILPTQIRRQMEALQSRQAASRPGIFNQQAPSSSIWSEESGPSSRRSALAQATGGASEASSKSSLLAQMFMPPFEMIYQGSWDQARKEGREGEKWLLINIQDVSVFDCQVLNRDLWKNKGVMETVKEHFLFLQYTKDDANAETYINYYFPGFDDSSQYPHIAIVDPRTGEQVKVWSRKVPNPAEFLMQLHEFLDRYSLKANARNPVAKRKPEVKREKQIHQMTEEEMLEMAVQESLATQTAQTKDEDPDDLTRSVGDLGKGKAVAESDVDEDMMDIAAAANGHAQSPVNVASPFSLIPSDRPHTQPAPGPGTTRIQFRYSGGRIIRAFALSDPVRRIYEWLKAEPLEDKAGVEFELISMSKNLIEVLENTIEEAGLKNGTVMIEFLEG